MMRGGLPELQPFGGAGCLQALAAVFQTAAQNER
jgi:hypothetical protein